MILMKTEHSITPIAKSPTVAAVTRYIMALLAAIGIIVAAGVFPSMAFAAGDNETAVSVEDTRFIIGNDVTVTVKVTPVSASAHVPTGTVTLTGNIVNSGFVYGTGTLTEADNGTVNITLPTRDLKENEAEQLKVEYSGDDTFAQSDTNTWVIPSVQGETTLTLNSDSASVIVGNNASVTATVTSPVLGAIPSGDVEVYKDGQEFASGTLGSAGTVDITLPTSDLKVADEPYTLTVKYPGDANFAAAVPDATFELTVEKADSKFEGSFPTSITEGDAATITITVYGDGTSIVPTGTVRVFSKDNDNEIGNFELDAEGKGEITLKDLPVGSNVFTVTYEGDDNFNPSYTTKPFTIEVKSGSTSADSEEELAQTGLNVAAVVIAAALMALVAGASLAVKRSRSH